MQVRSKNSLLRQISGGAKGYSDNYYLRKIAGGTGLFSNRYWLKKIFANKGLSASGNYSENLYLNILAGTTAKSDEYALQYLITNGINPTNLVSNGSFTKMPASNVMTVFSGKWIDGTANGSSNNTYGWYLFQKHPNSGAMFDKPSDNPGGSAILLSLADAGGACLVFDQPTPAKNVPMLPNVTYRLRYRIKVEGVSGTGLGAGIIVSERDSTGSLVVENQPPYINVNQTWTTQEFTFTTSASTRYVLLKLSANGLGAGGSIMLNAWFDDITLMRIS